MENNLPSEFAILCNTPEEAQICIDWAKRNSCKIWRNAKSDRFCKMYPYFKKDKENDYWFSHENSDYENIPLTSLTEEQVEIIGYECPMDLYGDKIKKGDRILLEFKRDILNEYYIEFVGNAPVTLPVELVESWKPIYAPKVKTQREIDHELIDKISINVYGVSNTEFSDYLKENNYAIVKREYEN